MKARLAAMEQEAAKLKEQQDKAQKEAGMGPGGGAATSAADAAAKEEADSRSGGGCALGHAAPRWEQSDDTCRSEVGERLTVPQHCAGV